MISLNSQASTIEGLPGRETNRVREVSPDTGDQTDRKTKGARARNAITREEALPPTGTDRLQLVQVP